MKIALICSHGGHLTEMLYLMDAFKEHEVFFITYDNIRTRNLEYKTYLFPNFGEGKLTLIPFKMLKYMPHFIRILKKEKPDLIISNGAEIAIPFFYLSKLFMIKTVFIECYTRISTPTGTGKLVYPFSNLFLVLWPEMLKNYGKKAQYWGGMFVILDNYQAKRSICKNIFVITGMHSGFDRLVKKMDEIAGKLDYEVIIQTGNTKYKPKHVDYFEFKPYDEIKETIKGSCFVICQGAMTVMDSLSLGTPVIVIPRLKHYGEHLDDHQLHFAKKLEEEGLVSILTNENQLYHCISKFNYLKVKKILINQDLIRKLNNYLIYRSKSTKS